MGIIYIYFYNTKLYIKKIKESKEIKERVKKLYIFFHVDYTIFFVLFF